MKSKLIIKPAKVRGYCFTFNSQKLSSNYNPIKEAENLISNYRKYLSQTKEGFVIFIGLFPIYQLAFIQSINPHLKLIVLEVLPIDPQDLDQAWKKVQEDFPQFNIHRLVIYSQTEDIIASLKNLNTNFIGHSWCIPSPYVDPNLTSTLINFYQRWRNQKITETRTEDYFYKLWNLHTLQNLKQGKGILIKSFLDLNEKRIKNNNVAFLVSSGIGLDEALHHYRDKICKLSTQYPFFTVPSIAYRLLKNKVTISALISTDAGFANTFHFSKLKNYCDQLPLIVPFSIHPWLARNWKNLIFYWDMEEHSDLLTSSLGKHNYISIDGSVVLSAIRILFHFGFHHIYTIGIDFTMNPFKEHALSNTTEEIFFNKSSRLQNYTTLMQNLYHREIMHQGDKVYQSQSLYFYQQQFYKLVNTFKNKGMVIDSISNLPWKPFLKNGVEINFTSKTKSYPFQEVYNLIKNKFKKQISNSFTEKEENSPKNTWLLRRWERI